MRAMNKRAIALPVVVVAALVIGLSDAQAVGTPVLLKDINPGPASSEPDPVTAVGDRLFFSAFEPEHGYELWTSDGTEAGTRLFKDINPGSESSGPLELIDFGGTLFFTADDGVHGRELWKSDGTEAGTALVKDIAPGSFGASPQYPTVLGDTLLFAAFVVPNSPSELWKTDGTEAGTVPVNPGGAEFAPNHLTRVGGTVFFTATDSAHGTELWKTDGTAAGTMLVKDVNPGPANGSSLGPSEDSVVGNTLYFVGFEPVHGGELWRTDGTEAGTVLVKDIIPGSGSSTSGATATPQALGGTLFFSASDPEHGGELWKTDGTEAGTQLVKDIDPGPAHSGAHLKAAVGETLFFTAFHSVHGNELWKSDGTEAGTVLVKDINPEPLGSFPNSLTPGPGLLLFMARDTAGTGLWRSDGTEAGTVPIEGADAYGLSTVGNKLYFIAFDPDHGFEPRSVVLVDTVAAAVDVQPKTINKKARGQYITVYVQFPTGVADPADINVATVTLQAVNPVTSARLNVATGSPTAVGDGNHDGIPDRMVKFDRATVQSWFAGATNVTFRVEGTLADGRSFSGDDLSVRVIAEGSEHTNENDHGSVRP